MTKLKTMGVLLLGVALLTALTAMLSACGGDSSSGKATVTYMTWENATTNASIDSAMAKFSDPNITVKRIDSPSSDFDQKIKSLTLAKQLPDFFWCGNDQEQSLGQQGALYDWSSHFAKGEGFQATQFAPGAIENWRTPDGKLFGLPTLMNTYGYFYNPDLLQAAGVTIPTDTWTYDDFFAAVQKLTKKDGDKTTTYGAVGGPYTDPFLMNVYGVSAGGQSFEDKIVGTSKVTIDPKLVEGTQRFASAIQAGYLTPPTYNGGDTNAAFLGGKIPLLWGGQWNAASFIQSNPNFKFGFVSFPQVSKRVVIYDAVGICSPSYIKNPDAVWKVMTYLDTKAWNDILPGAPVAPAAYVPASSAYFDTLKSKGASSVADSVNYELQTPDKLGVRFMAPWATKANDIITANWNDVLTGKKPAQPTLDDMASQLNTLIKSGS